jgi:hypothetical protein
MINSSFRLIVADARLALGRLCLQTGIDKPRAVKIGIGTGQRASQRLGKLELSGMVDGGRANGRSYGYKVFA